MTWIIGGLVICSLDAFVLWCCLKVASDYDDMEKRRRKEE